MKRTIVKAIALSLFAAAVQTASAQDLMKVTTSDADLTFKLTELDRITFSDDESEMHIALTNGKKQTVFTDQLYTITFIDEQDPSTGISTVAEGQQASDVAMTLSNGMLHIAAASPIRHINIYDESGRQLFAASGESSTADIPMAELSTGIRVVKVQTDAGTTARKMIVKK